MINNGRFTKKCITERKEWKEIIGIKSIDIQTINTIKNIWNTDPKIQNRPCCIIFLANCAKFNLKHVNARYKRYMKIPNKKGNSLYNYIIRYGKEEGKKRFLTKNKMSSHTKDNLIKKYGEIEGNKRYKEICRKKRNTKERFIERYGEIEGNIRYDQFCENNKGNWSLERKIQLYGEIRGIEIYNEQRQALIFNKSLSGYIKKYGINKGIKKYEENIKKLHTAARMGYSKKSQKLFDDICLRLNNFKYEIYYATRNNEYRVGSYFLDFAIPDLKIGIEFFGDRFHANPDIFLNEDTPNPFDLELTANVIRKNDEIRLNYLKKEKYKILVIWESEYKTSPKNTIEKCCKFILNALE